ncbi:XrtB/PEP-CTERM-associated polysaccharide biosynthesis outer membrane protein EpsL [Ramlibacter rhizophilus]|uniref:Outer membrane beta-barrel protein n=1 Tax=Ramlibacter rhizophilus TaxID=1781167 RepID=A0A4Z0BKY7_9BURK|nr:XrtB/PEP-CTERM-associated polysaccharide biosynthesis outer membrane protein EpsL [Ramlibacter rhizophilus]TFY99986.1 hypothetical protein EZ242_12725 [Ramlibacter rhizophilus]
MSKKLRTNAWMPVACLCIAWPLAHAQNPETGDTLQFRVGAGVEHDSNVLRAPNGESDTIGILSAGARIDKRYSLQRIVLDAELAAYRHQDFSDLNYSTFNYSAAWNYAFTPRFTGVLSATQREYRDTTTATTGVTEAFVRTERTQLLEGTYAPGGGFLALAGLSHRTSDSEVARSIESSPSVTSLRLGTGYEFRSGARAVVVYRRGDGSYDNLAADFKENELAVEARLPLTAKTSVNGKLGWLERNHEGAAAAGLDFSGMIANVEAAWEITGKTSLTGGFERDIGAYETAGGGNVRAWRTYIQPIWRATAKTQVRLRYAHETRDWNTNSAAAPDAGREDDVNTFGVFVDWEPRRNLLVTGTVRQERRDSNVNAFDYRANIVGVAAKYSF